MLIRFSIENFLSFRDRVEFSMIPGKGTLKNDHKSKKIKDISALRTSVIFGANASGKSNLIKAIAWGQRMILRGNKNDQGIIYQPFKLDVDKIKSNSRIEYEFQSGGNNYAYGFAFNSEIILEEWLYSISKRSQSPIFERTNDKFTIDPLFQKNNTTEQKQFLTFITKATPSNQLFITEILTRKVKDNVTDIGDLLNVIEWFQNTLKVIFPDDKYNEGVKSGLQEDSKLKLSFEELLKYFGTGIDGICLEKISPDEIKAPSKIVDKIVEDLLASKSKNVRSLLTSARGETYFITKKNNDILFSKLMTKHKIRGSSNHEKFDTSDESDGTNRVIDYIPVILDLLLGENVFIIDELERSLHPNITYDLFELFLTKGKNVNSQLIVSTHESSLLTQNLLRKDEIWFVVKDNEGASHIHSLENYNVRFDKKIRTDYLLGRFRAIPKIGNKYDLSTLPTSD